MGAARGAVGGGPFLEEGVGGLGFELFASCVEADDVVNQGFLVEENVQADRADEGPEEVKSVLSVPIHDGLGRDVGTGPGDSTHSTTCGKAEAQQALSA